MTVPVILYTTCMNYLFRSNNNLFIFNFFAYFDRSCHLWKCKHPVFAKDWLASGSQTSDTQRLIHTDCNNGTKSVILQNFCRELPGNFHSLTLGVIRWWNKKKILHCSFSICTILFRFSTNMISSQTLWGELPPPPDTDRGIANMEREQMAKLRSLEVEGPRLHQPSSRHQPPSKE